MQQWRARIWAGAAVCGLLSFAVPVTAQTPPSAAASAPASTPAPPPVSVEGAQMLAKTLADELAAFLPPSAGKGTQGPVLVMPAGDQYVAALPGFVLHGQEQERLDFGGIWLTLKPLADGTYAVTAKLPGSAVYMENGDPAAVATLGDQKISGVWSPTLQSFLSLQVQISDLQITSVYDDFWLGAGSLTYRQDLKPEPVAGEGWSGPATVSVADLRMEKGEDALLSIGGMTAETTYSRFRLDKTTQLMQSGKTGANADVWGLFSGLIGGATSKVELRDVAATDPDSKQAAAFDFASMTFAAANFDRALASTEFNFQLKGLSFEPAPADEAALPTAGDLKLSLYNIPIQELLKLAGGAFSASPPPGDPLAAALAVLEKAKTTLLLESFGAETAALQVRAAGEAFPRAGAAFGAVAKAKLTLSGVDKLLNDLKPKKGGKPDPANADLIGGLTMLKAMGRPEKDKGGKAALSYTFEITDQGTFLVNDADLAPLLEGAK